MLRTILLFLMFLDVTVMSAQVRDVPAFINQFREIAVDEMHRTGIPASIKLAQAILESSAGTSELALRSNNFFGLKCGADWGGPTYYKEDDDYDRRGRLIPSCFRAFETPEASFMAHSDFLMHPKKAYRYGWLFSIDRHEYKSWAWGLKESGYATNPRYALLLINLIEDHELYSYDYYEPGSLMADIGGMNTADDKVVVPAHAKIEKRKMRTTGSYKPSETVDLIEGVVTNNGRDMVYAKKGDTPLEIAERYHTSLKDIIKYNERLEDAGQSLQHAERIYFERKKKSYKGSKKEHIVSEGQTMYEIAQIYGIRLEKLYNRNRLYPGSEPAVGEKIRLRGMVRSKDRPRVRTAAPVKSKPIPEISDLTDVHTSTLRAPKGEHVVSKGETLYSIANRYQMSVDVLKGVNKLDSNIINPGQILYVEK